MTEVRTIPTVTIPRIETFVIPSQTSLPDTTPCFGNNKINQQISANNSSTADGNASATASVTATATAANTTTTTTTTAIRRPLKLIRLSSHKVN